MTLTGADLTRALAGADDWQQHDNGRLWVNGGKLDVLARDGLGIKHPISLRFVAELRDGTWGTHTFSSHVHVIRIRSGLSVDDTAATILHEVAHAVQAQTWGEVHALRQLVGDPVVEREAERFAEMFAHLDLVRE